MATVGEESILAAVAAFFSRLYGSSTRMPPPLLLQPKIISPVASYLAEVPPDRGLPHLLEDRLAH